MKLAKKNHASYFAKIYTLFFTVALGVLAIPITMIGVNQQFSTKSSAYVPCSSWYFAVYSSRNSGGGGPGTPELTMTLYRAHDSYVNAWCGHFYGTGYLTGTQAPATATIYSYYSANISVYAFGSSFKQLGSYTSSSSCPRTYGTMKWNYSGHSYNQTVNVC